MAVFQNSQTNKNIHTKKIGSAAIKNSFGRLNNSFPRFLIMDLCVNVLFFRKLMLTVVVPVSYIQVPVSHNASPTRESVAWRPLWHSQLKYSNLCTAWVLQCHAHFSLRYLFILMFLTFSNKSRLPSFRIGNSSKLKAQSEKWGSSGKVKMEFLPSPCPPPAFLSPVTRFGWRIRKYGWRCTHL